MSTQFMRRAVAVMAKSMAQPTLASTSFTSTATTTLAPRIAFLAQLGGVRGIKMSKQFQKIRQKQTEDRIQSRSDEFMAQLMKQQQETQVEQSEQSIQADAPEMKLTPKQKAQERRNVLLDLHSKRNPDDVRIGLIDNLASDATEIPDLTTREYTHIYQTANDIGAAAAWKSALALFVAQLKRGVPVEPNTYRALTTLFEGAQQWPLALSILETWRREFPTPIFNELGDKVRQELPAYTPIDYAAYTATEHSNKSPVAGKKDEFEQYVLLRRELKYSVASQTYELYLNRLLVDKRNDEAVAFYFQLMNEMGLSPSAQVPEPNAPIDLYPYSRTTKDTFHLSLGTTLRVARAAELIGNYAAALTVFHILRSRYNIVGVVPVREVVAPKIGTHARVALDDDIDGAAARAAEGVNRQRDFLDLHNTHVPGIMMVLKTYLCELRARRGYVAAMTANGATPAVSGTNWSVLSEGVPAVLSSEPAETLEILTDRTYTSSDVSACGARARKVCELLSKLPNPLQATAVISPAGFDAMVRISKTDLLRWCEGKK